MTFRAYLWLMGWMTAIAWAGWVFVLWTVDPGEAGWVGLVLFYVTLFAALMGTFAVGGALYRVGVLKRHEVVYREVRITFRHAILVSAVGITSLALSAFDLFRPWVFLVMIAVIGVVEYVFLLVQESQRN